jgi:hypothetical protein
MAAKTITAPATDKETDDSNFVSLSSLKSYATATASLTMVLNVIMYIYKQVQLKDMALGLVVPIAILLSTAYIISFFKKDKKATRAQHVWITALNAIMLFTSVSGVNGMLDSAQISAAKANANTPARSEQSVGDFFKHVFLPTHGWFNVTEMDDNERSQIIQQTINSIDSTQKVIDTLITQKQKDLNTIDTLHKSLDTVRTEYIKTLTKITEAQNTLQQLQAGELHPHVREQINHVQATIQGSQQQLLQQRQERELHRVPQPTETQPVQHLQIQQRQLQIQKRQLYQQKAVQQATIQH